MIGERLAELRKLNGEKQQVLAKALSVSVSTVRSWEHDKSSPDHSTLVAICRRYHTSSDFLLGLSDYDPSDKARIQRQRLTEEEQNEMHRYEEYLLWKRKNKPPSETVRSLGGCFVYKLVVFSNFFQNVLCSFYSHFTKVRFQTIIAFFKFFFIM